MPVFKLMLPSVSTFHYDDLLASLRTYIGNIILYALKSGSAIVGVYSKKEGHVQIVFFSFFVERWMILDGWSLSHDNPQTIARHFVIYGQRQSRWVMGFGWMRTRIIESIYECHGQLWKRKRSWQLTIDICNHISYTTDVNTHCKFIAIKKKGEKIVLWPRF